MEKIFLLKLICFLEDNVDDDYILSKLVEIENYLRIKLINKNESNK